MVAEPHREILAKNLSFWSNLIRRAEPNLSQKAETVE